MQNYKEIFEQRGHEYNSASLISADARQKEVDTLLDLVQFAPDLRIIDIPAGGGIVAKRIEERALAHDDVICIEPSKRFAAAIPSHFSVLHDEIDVISLEDKSVDLILSLAGLHHIDDRQSIYQEWFRLLRPGGQLVVADVRENTPTALFLNGFVNDNNSYGHEGTFIEKNEFSKQLTTAGFQVVRDELTHVPWHFSNKEQLGKFCKSLFNMDKITAHLVAKGVEDILGISKHKCGVNMHWQLQYASATKSKYSEDT